MSSFQRRKKEVIIPGSKASLQNGQLIISTGNPSMDSILGGGLPIGSMLLIEEDKYATYTKSLVKYFLAEGAVHKNALFIASLDDDCQEFIRKIPTPSAESRTQTSAGTESSQLNLTDDSADMRIAWRYNNLPIVDAEQKTTTIGHSFDLTKPIDDDTLKSLNIQLFNDFRITESDPSFQQTVFGRLLASVKENLNNLNAHNAADNCTKKLLRICVNSLGSPMWYGDEYKSEICRFLITLKALVRNSQSVCCITMPTHLMKHYDPHIVYRIRALVDFAIELESFAGSDKETNPIFKEYHGLLYIRKIAALNTLAAYTPETHDLAFKLRRKKFVIEKLHLPPELQEPESTANASEIEPSMSCGSTTKHILEF